MKKAWSNPTLEKLSVEKTLGGGGFVPTEQSLVNQNPGSNNGDFPNNMQS